jgi:hAT family C-terminal dimerisation region
VFSILASIICDIFIVLIFIIAFESYFNATNRVLTNERTRLSEKVFEAPIFIEGLIQYRKVSFKIGHGSAQLICKKLLSHKILS